VFFLAVSEYLDTTGNFAHYMLKEIHEQPDSLTNTMRGRVQPSGKIVLGGIQKHLFDIRRARRLVFIACGTSYNSALAVSQTHSLFGPLMLTGNTDTSHRGGADSLAGVPGECIRLLGP
jgi:glucosamine 6-phosphate synthetase-like amidotransferase/phosphosugar isomerase protein